MHQNKPSRESIFCGKIGDWLTKRALTMLNSLPKTRQNTIVPHTGARVTERKACMLIFASASGWWACCSLLSIYRSIICQDGLSYNSYYLALLNSQIHQIINSQTYQSLSSSTRKLANLQTHQLINSQTYQFLGLSTRKLINSSAHKLINSSAHQLKNPQTHKLTNSQTHQLIRLYILIRCKSPLCYQCVKKLKNLHHGSIFFLKRLAWYLKKPYLCIRFRERSSLVAIEKEFIERFT